MNNLALKLILIVVLACDIWGIADTSYNAGHSAGTFAGEKSLAQSLEGKIVGFAGNEEQLSRFVADENVQVVHGTFRVIYQTHGMKILASDNPREFTNLWLDGSRHSDAAITFLEEENK